jgi:stearoyl-CoA desaturase (delta-9 desaturase)
MSTHFYKIILPNWILSSIAIAVLITNFQWLFVLYAVLGYYLIGVLGASIGFHRYVTHGSFKTNNFWKYYFLITGSLTGQGSPIFWAGLHIFHHKVSDTEKDIHSPLKGKFNSFIGWQINSSEGIPAIAPRWLYTDPIVKFIHKNYYKFYWTVVVIAYLIDLHFGLFFMTLGSWFLITNSENLGNLILHSPNMGYQNYDLGDNSRNNHWYSFFTLGAGYHNNHHKHPGNYKFSHRSYELDLGAKFIELIKI